MNVDFWCRILGLRLVKKTLNYETTFRYHPYYGDENGRPGSVVTFLEFTDLPRGVPGDGNIQRIVLRVGSFEAADFWLRRLAGHQVYSEMLRLDPRQPTRLIFHDFEGHGVELMVTRRCSITTSLTRPIPSRLVASSSCAPTARDSPWISRPRSWGRDPSRCRPGPSRSGPSWSAT